MKKILSLILATVIILSSIINAIVVFANSNPIITTEINLNASFNYSFVTTNNSSSTTFTPGSDKLAVTVSNYERQLSGITSYSEKTWFPRYLPYKNGEMFAHTVGSKVIVEVKYKVIGSINTNHGVQIGIGSNSSGNNNEIYVRTSRKHIQGDEGKEFVISSSFTVDSNKYTKIAFSGGGKLEISSIVIHELPVANINDYVVVNYVDGDNVTKEFVKKNSSVKTPTDTTDFKGWYLNSDYTGEPVTTVSSDTTLYADRRMYFAYDVLKTKSTSPANVIGSQTGATITMNSSKVTVTASNGYNLSQNGLNKARPTFLFLTQDNGTKSKFMTKSGMKYVVEMEYVVTSRRSDSFALQVGLLGNISDDAKTENSIWLDSDAEGNKLYKTHPSADNGKTIKYAVSFTATSSHNIGLVFYGQGAISINSITIKETTSDHLVVKYVDENDETIDIVRKNDSTKLPQKEGLQFGGWYTNSNLSGEAVSTITSDVTLYAKWIETTSYEVLKIESDTPDNLIGQNYRNEDDYVNLSMSGSKITVSTFNGYNLSQNNWHKWRPTFLFLTESNGSKNKFMTKENSKYIVEMEYVVESSRTDNQSLQVGLLGNLDTYGQTENAIWLDTDADGKKLYNVHPASDNGKTIKYTVAFNATSSHNLGLVFYGQGSITLKSITIKEAPMKYALVTFNDRENIRYEFLRKNTLLENLVLDGCEFNGWYQNAEFTGEAVTTILDDISVYAKWTVNDGKSVVTFKNIDNDVMKVYTVGSAIDYIPSREGYNFLGWYKYDNFYGRAVKKATYGFVTLYAKWEEKDPVSDQFVDLTKNDVLKTTDKSKESTLKLENDKLVLKINNYERQLNKTDTTSSDTWFPGYSFKDSSGKEIKLEIGTRYELEVTYKIVNVAAGDTVGLQIGFGADGQFNQTRTKNNGYAMHTSSDNGKEFTYSTTYTAEKIVTTDEDGKKITWNDHYPKLIFSGQGVLEVTSVKITKNLPVLKDIVIGVQTYEDYKEGTATGVLGNKKGTEISKTANHTSGLFKNKSLKLDINTDYLRLSGNTIISVDKNGEMKPYVAEVGEAYKITFYMYATQNMDNLHWSINSADEAVYYDYLSYFRMEKDGEVDLKKGEWKEIVAYIPVLQGGESSKNLFAIAVASSEYDGKSVYIDDVKIEQLVDSEIIFYDTQGGKELSPQRAFKGNEILTFKEPVRDGYLFDGWYYEPECLNEAKTYDKFPSDKDEITLYAKWIEAPTTAYDFTAGSFDTEIYNSGVTPYVNSISDADSKFEGENEKGMTQNSVWVKDAGIYANGSSETDGALAFSNELYSSYKDLKSYNAVRLVNQDGTPFTVVKGERYTIKFDYIFASSKGLSYIVPLISEHSAYENIGRNTTQTIGRVSVMETDTDYLTYSQSFIAEKTGYVYLTLTGRDDNARVETHCYEKVYVDNLEIKRTSNVTKIDIKSGNTLWFTKYGVSGEKFVLPNAVKTGTDTFDGLYLDPEFKTKFNGYYPANDTTLYVKLKKDKYDKPSDFSNPIVLDFEETELLTDFYRQQKYMTSWSRETENEWIFVTDDEKNALNGKNYIKLNGYSHYWNEAKFALYDTNHPENVMLLDKGGKYRVTLMVRCEDIYEAPINMTICLENPSKQHLLEENESVKLTYTPSGDRNGYYMFVGDIEVPTDMKYYPSLAIRRNANDLQTIFIDTVSVEKLRDCTVKFDENGGTPVDDIVVQIHDTIYDPGIPFKDGFVFDGWFIDENFSKAWDFDNDTVEKDMTLYGKWSVEVIDETTDETDDEDYDDDYTSDTDDEDTAIDNGMPPNLLDADKVVIDQSDDNTSNSGMPIWLIIVICVGGLLVVAGVTLTTIVLVRKKK